MTRACLGPASLQVHGTEPHGNKVERGSGTPNASSGLSVYIHMHTPMFVLAVFTGPCKPSKRHTSLMYTHVTSFSSALNLNEEKPKENSSCEIERVRDGQVDIACNSDFSVVYCENK